MCVCVSSAGEQVRPVELFYDKVHLLASKVADCPELLASSDVQFLQLNAVDGDDDDGSAAVHMQVHTRAYTHTPHTDFSAADTGDLSMR